MQSKSSSSGPPTSLEPHGKDNPREHADTGLLRASYSASIVALSLNNFRHFVKEQYPHWIEAVALVDVSQETLRQQYGRPCSEDFIWDMFTNNIPLRSSREAENVVVRRANLSELGREFQAFHPFHCSKGNRVDLSESFISEKMYFLREWLDESQMAQAHPD